VFADKAMLETVLRNLISNAIKYSKNTGEVKIGAEQLGVETIVSIRDNGIGIPKKHIHKLFSIDGKYSTLGTMNEHGTGLGLILCHEFVKIHGGNIWVESEEGIGTSIYFSLPANL
jgi:signal transduction histidine kinase